ncbi:helix-turn-helix domain-containing protein, partial [Thermodesulfobacteriota bacterium]
EPIKPKDLLSANSFDVFWKEYPKKKGKKPALKAWLKISPSEQLQQQILSSLQKQKDSKDWQKKNEQYIPYPASWLNDERWNDEVKPQTSDKFW